MKAFLITTGFIAAYAAADNVDKLPNPILDVLGYGVLGSVIGVLVWLMFKIARNI